LVALSTVIGLVAPYSVEAATKKVAKKKVVRYHMSVSAIKGKDEKDFANPVSRCLTADMKALDAKAVATMEAEIKKYGAGHEKAVASYKEKLDTVWSAMEQPYCGYGAYGMTAVKKSFNKSTERALAEFLAEVK
jgi:hypothetical protein